jgi:3-methylcrotonyl-CoA carboxylase alpha subunit
MDDKDEEGDPRFYFMEMNTRLQVEHPVTEAITGLDLVEWQLRVARGEMLPLMQDAIEAKGWAMEARLCAENPDAGFLPATGTLERLDFAQDARIETGVRAGDAVTVHYDSMIAKIITAGATRDEARRRLVQALDQTVVEGVTTNRALLARLAAHPAFAAGDVSTGFIATHAADLFAPRPLPADLLQTAAASILPPPDAAPFARPFRLNLPAETHVALYGEDGTAHALKLPATPAGLPGTTIVRIDDETLDLRAGGDSWRLFTSNPRWSGAAAEGPSDGSITAPMPGKLLSLHVRQGDTVKAGDRLLVLEAMKMEHRMTAPFDGTVETVSVEAGAQVTEGTLLVRLARA